MHKLPLRHCLVTLCFMWPVWPPAAELTSSFQTVQSRYVTVVMIDEGLRSGTVRANPRAAGTAFERAAPDSGEESARDRRPCCLERPDGGCSRVTADDRRRRRYARWLAGLRRRQVAVRRSAAAELPPPPEAVDPEVGFVVAPPDARMGPRRGGRPGPVAGKRRADL